MTKSAATGTKAWKSVLCCAVGIFAFAAALSGWLSHPELAGQIWPDDINTAVASFLGGTRQQNALGQRLTVLSTSSVWLRIAMILLVLTGLKAICTRVRQPSQHSAADLLTSLYRSGLVLVSACLWWLLWLIGDATFPSLKAFCVASLPLWLTTTMGVLCWTWCSAFISPSERAPVASKPKSVRPITLLTICAACWIAGSFWMNWRLYDQVLIPHGDSAMYEEHLWNVWHGKGFRSYLDQGLFLGEHIQIIHLLLLPLHYLWPSHLLLELTESIALGSCVIPVYLIAVRHTRSPWAAAVIGIAWLFYYPMHFLDIAIDQKTFRPVALGLPFVFWLIEFAERGSLKWAALSLVVALSAKEDMALVLCPLLAVLAWRARTPVAPAGTDSGVTVNCSQWKWLAAGSVFCAVYLILAVLVVIPAFRSGDHVHYARYFGDLGGTPGELMKTAITDPLRVIVRIFSMRTVLYICVFLVPLAFLPARRPLLLASGIFTFGMLSLLELGNDGGLPPIPYHHFHAPLLPVVFWAAVVGIGSVGRCTAVEEDSIRKNTFSRAGLVLCCCVATCLTGSLMPVGVSFWSKVSPFGLTQLYCPSDLQQQSRAQAARRVVEQIPLTARVASTDYIHTRLTHCERSYDYSNYLRAVNNYQPGVPSDTEYIVIDTQHRYSEIRSADDIPELNEAKDEWQLLPDRTDGIFLILKRADHPRNK